MILGYDSVKEHKRDLKQYTKNNNEEESVSHIQIYKTEMFNKDINTVSQNKENRETIFINKQSSKPKIPGSNPGGRIFKYFG